MQLGFLPRDVARWVSPLSDIGFFSFSAFIYPKEVITAAIGERSTKIQLLINVSKASGIFFSFFALRHANIDIMCFQAKSVLSPQLILIFFLQCCECHEIQGPRFAEMPKLITPEHFVSLCLLVASLQRHLGLWRLREV